MGNSCCHAESPCGSAEERSGLLKDDSKVTVPPVDSVVECTFPEENDDIRKIPDEVDIKVEAALQGKQSPEANSTQENGPLQKEVIRIATPPRSKESERKENSTTLQDEDMRDRPADTVQAEHLQCTFNSLQKQHATADWAVFTATTEEENPASAQDKIPDCSSLTAEVVCPESHTGTNATSEHVPLDTTRENEVAGSKNAEAEMSGEFSPNNEVLHVPNPQITAAARQTSLISTVGQESDKESPSCAVTEDSESGSSEVQKSHDACESPPLPEPTKLSHSGEEGASANCVREPDATARADASESSKSGQDTQPDAECQTPSPKEVTSLENIRQDIGEGMMPKEQDKEEGDPKVEDEIEEEEESAHSEGEAGKDAEVQEVTGKEEQLAGSMPNDVKADEIPVTEEEDSDEDDLGNSEEDLYRGADELSALQRNQPETTPVKVEDRCSLAPAVDVVFYSEREWKGNTAKSALIRKGYKEMSQRFGSVRRVRGDNYCALRATLFQVLAHSTQLPAWLQEEDNNMLLKHLEAQDGLISQWTFPGECLQGDGSRDVTLQLKGYMELLRDKWQAAVDCSSAVERQQLCERVFQGGEEELGLLEALKLLMLGRAVELHGCMQGGRDVPLFCWLLFARDSSSCPRSFLSNHLSHVGLSAGLEQVEMFLLGYALQCTIQVYRLYKADTEEFVTYYPDDHKDDWPSVCLVTEDDRHYNVPVVEAAGETHKRLNSS